MKKLWIAVEAVSFIILGAPVFTMHGQFQTSTQDGQKPDLIDIKRTVRSANAKIANSR